MKRFRFNNDSGKSLFCWFVLLGGFLLGVLLPNIFWKTQIQKGGFAGIYLMETFTRAELAWEDYFLLLIKERMTGIFLLMICGVSVFGIPAALFMSVWTGFFLGGVLTVSILQFGAVGGVVGLGLFFPQYALYLPVLFVLASMACSFSCKCWKNQKITAKELRSYGGKCLLLIGIQTAGIALECFLNPVCVEFLINKLQIF